MNQNNKLSPTIYEKIITVLFLYVAFVILYGTVNRIISIPGGFDLTTSLDRQIPFIPFFVYPFYLAYIIFPMPVLFIDNRAQMKIIATAFLSMLILACIVFLIFPVYVPRPDVTPGTFTQNIIVQIYEMDRPVCAFPSLHAAISFFAALIIFKISSRWGLLLLMFSLLTSLSVLFIKQHVILDIIGGFFLSTFVYWGFRRFL